jgi:hypothetical protein
MAHWTGAADGLEVVVDMGCGVVGHSAGLTRVRIADHGNLPESEAENVAHGASARARAD